MCGIDTIDRIRMVIRYAKESQLKSNDKTERYIRNGLDL